MGRKYTEEEFNQELRCKKRKKKGEKRAVPARTIRRYRQKNLVNMKKMGRKRYLTEDEENQLAIYIRYI